MKNYYAIIGVSGNASAAEIRAAYRKLARQVHPDFGGDAEACKNLTEAYAVLGDPKKRRAYDLQFKVREFVPPAAGAALDVISLFGVLAAGRVPASIMEQVSPVLERKLEDVGINARAATVEDVFEALGWLKPKRKKRA